ncbi:MAG: hypothetical protein RLZ98_3465 [Pseudomonadota bacterium]
MTDDFGTEIKAGDRLSLSVGIPPREVVVTVTERNGRMSVKNAEGQMSLVRALRYFPAEVVR